MLTESNYKTKLTINILMASMTVLLLVIFIFDIKLECLFKTLLHINCPTCGLTRSFKAIINFDFVKAFNENILGIPIFITIILIYIFYMLDLFFKTNILINIYNKSTKHYKVIICILLILTIINNY